MTNDELLTKIKEDRPEQKIYEVISFTEIEPGIYDVMADIEINLFGFKTRSYMGIVFPRFKFHNVLNLPHYD